MSGKILIVDDEIMLTGLLGQHFEDNGYHVWTAGSSQEALTLLSKQPDEGEVFWEGVPVGKMEAAYRGLLGYAPQQQGLYESFTGRRFLSHMGTLKKLPGKEMKAEIVDCAGYDGESQADE